METKWKRPMVYVIVFTLALLIMGGCVSKKEYLLKAEEGEKLSGELKALKTEHERLKGEKETLDKRAAALQKERNNLEEARNQVQLEKRSLEDEVSFLVSDNEKLEEILGAKSDALSKNIVDLRDHIASLKKENSSLKS